LHLKVTRFQKPDQAGEPSVRDGVFFIPHDDMRSMKEYKTTKTRTDKDVNYGGSQRFSGAVHLKQPLIVKASTGGGAPEAAYAAIKGKLETEAMINACSSAREIGKSDDERINHIRNILHTYGGNENLAEHLFYNSRKGNQLKFALQENIVANTLKRHGYDSLLSYNKKGWGHSGHHLTELFDLRRNHYPKSNEELSAISKYPCHAWDRYYFRHTKPIKKDELSFVIDKLELAVDAFLRTAVKTKDKIYAGDQGEKHSDLFDRLKLKTRDVKDCGFLNDKNQYVLCDGKKAINYALINDLAKYPQLLAKRTFDPDITSEELKIRKFPKIKIINIETSSLEVASRTGILHHFTSISDAHNILNDRAFRLSTTMGTDPETQQGKEPFYLSTTRNKKRR
jgi:hypothetical protein